MKSPGGRGGHSRTAQDDALVKKKKKNKKRGAWPASFAFQILRLLGKIESDNKILLKTITL